MRPTLPSLTVGLLLSVLAAVCAAGAPVLVANDGVRANSTNPYNSPIQRANPNSRQGSIPASPPVRGPSTEPIVRPPTLENRGIGNGDNLRRQQQAPALEPARPPRDSSRTP
ncbi:hypothetical protein [Pseudomonas cremoricolorata]|uniref:hypothetical protein n=1 Tax=Pseudomonas cremoricolorata TaxID=157783 RepID=UPI0003FCAC91|nr:hypothetical protein [Pseudomonas cremoricolorata]